MAFTSPNMGLKIWNLITDLFAHNDLQNNFANLDAHDHSSGKGVQIASAGLATGAVTTAKIAAGAVTANQIANGTITSTQLAFIPLVFGSAPVAYRLAPSSTSANPGDWISASAGVNIALPTPTQNAIIAITTSTGTLASNPVTVSCGSTIYGAGLAGFSFVLGTPSATVVLYGSTNYGVGGTSWVIASGQPDTGWLTPAFGANWVDAGGGAFPVGARRVGGSIELSGTIRSGTSTNLNSLGALLTLPAATWPSDAAYPVASYFGPGGAAGGLTLSVTTAGAVTGLAVAGTAGSYTINLDGVRFRAV